MPPIIDLEVRSDDGPDWQITPRTNAAKAWASKYFSVPLEHLDSIDVNASCMMQALYSARTAGFVISFTAEHRPMMFGVQDGS